MHSIVGAAAAARAAQIRLGFHLKCKAFRCASCRAVEAHAYVCVCVGVLCPGLGQLCAINKVIHLPQKLFENLPNSTDCDSLASRTALTCSRPDAALSTLVCRLNSTQLDSTRLCYDLANCLHCNENVFALGNIYACAVLE